MSCGKHACWTKVGVWEIQCTSWNCDRPSVQASMRRFDLKGGHGPHEGGGVSG